MSDTETAERTPAEAMQAEVDAEKATQEANAVEHPEGTITVPLGDLDDGGIEMHVLPVDSWRSSAQSDLRTGNFDAWAEQCLVEGDFERWCEYDPTLGEIKAMFDVWDEKSGQARGKSASSRRFSTGSRRR